MKNNSSLSSSLGLTQEETAQLLGVSRGQLSMYESGKRSMPLPALQKLAGILSYFHQRETLASKKPQPINHKLLEECRAEYEREKELERLRRQRKLEKLEKKQTAAKRLGWLAEYLSQGKMEDPHGAQIIIAYKAKKGFGEKEEKALWGLRVRGEELSKSEPLDRF